MIHIIPTPSPTPDDGPLSAISSSSPLTAIVIIGCLLACLLLAALTNRGDSDTGWR